MAFRVEVSFQHRAWDRWSRLRRVAWALAIGGVAGVIWASASDVPHAGAFLCLTVGASVLGVGNALAHTVGFRQQGDLLVMTRVHPQAVAAIRRAMTAPPQP
ncbi:hypothetical protein FHP29_09480 [Nocardioides albidus]|uniref:Uncharacterized protein n=1 Tax=Nocardioides albidus TaxID=1517589 RepID=A0A5C4VZ85_9ACTN|nr:hypothetical protein [Nocardioides albidus]TNM41218.1 hypothetical protein FHP29_09480 [Nocardioides albidus]